MRDDIGAWMARTTGEDYSGAAMPMSADISRWTSDQIAETPLTVLLACHRSATEADFRAELRRLDLTTLVIQGDADTSCPLELTGRPTAANVPDSRLVVIEGAGHGLYATAARYNGELLHFISACPTQARRREARAASGPPVTGWADALDLIPFAGTPNFGDPWRPTRSGGPPRLEPRSLHRRRCAPPRRHHVRGRRRCMHLRGPGLVRRLRCDGDHGWVFSLAGVQDGQCGGARAGARAGEGVA